MAKGAYIGVPKVDEHTLLLLHGDSLNDHSPYNRNMVNEGVVVSYEQSKLRSKSLYFDGKSRLATSGDPFDFGTGDFTIDFWVYWISGQGGFFCSGGFQGSMMMGLGSSGGIWMGRDYVAWDLMLDNSITQNTWTHVAVVRNSGTVLVFVNGKNIYSGAINTPYTMAGGTLGIGIQSKEFHGAGASGFTGYMDEYRISNVARWTSDFDVPTAPHGESVARKIKKGYIGVGNFPPKRLPSGYTQVEYIETSGTQYINTQFICNGNSKIEAEFEVLDANNNGAFLYGGGSGSARIEAYPWNATMEMNYGSLAPFVGSLVANKKFYICQDKGNFNFSYTDGSGSWTQEGETQTFDCVVPMAIFVLNRGTIYYPTGGMRLYWFKIYDNGTLVRDLVPCINSAGTAGLYDTVGQIFYRNAGTGEFTTGETLVEVARKIKKAYIGVGGVARLYWSGDLVITYSGNMTDQVVTMSGKQYRLLTLTNSGTLTVSDSVEAEVWMCGGGTSGGYSYRHPSLTTEGYAGGGGAGAFAATGTVTLNGNMAAIVGAGGSPTSSGSFWGTGTSTSFAGLATSAGFSANSATYGQISGINGGTGGGMGQTASPGTGDGVSKYPFGDSSYFRCHCAGGGAGAKNYRGTTLSVGGAGGTNGGDGGRPTTSDNSGAVPGGAGGVYGGGSGGTASYTHSTNHAVTDGENAFFYGSGGGGSSISFYTTTNDRNYKLSNAGAGYQGVIYIRIPVN